ncbi:MAG: gluconate transport inducer 1/Pac2, partial [Benniella sp.]
GRIEDTLDALIILEACRQGVLPKINRRLLAAERGETVDLPSPSLITPGSVFVFDEEESKICRWTDGRIWSPSRICGNFLVYRE